MKKINPIKSAILGVFCIAGILSLLALAPPKENPVKITLTTQEWEKVIKHLETANSSVLNSEIPSNKAQAISAELQNAVQLLGSKIEKEQIKKP